MNFKKFLVTVPCNLMSSFYMYMPKSFVLKYKDEIPVDVVLHGPNKDVFEVNFNRYCGCLVGLSKLFTRYGLRSSYLLLLEYCGGADFIISVFNCTSVEIEYPLHPEFHSLPKIIAGIIPLSPSLGDCSGRTLEDDINSATHSVSFYGHRKNQCMYFIDESSLSPPESIVLAINSDDRVHSLLFGGPIMLEFNDHTWEVGVSTSTCYVLLTKGWLTFAKTLALRGGDLCILEKIELNKRYSVAIYRNFQESVKKLQQGLKPKRFMKSLDKLAVEEGELYIPYFFSEVYMHEIPPTVVLITEDGLSFRAYYDRYEGRIHGFKSLFAEMEHSDAQTVMFHYFGNGVFQVTIFNTTGVDMFMDAA